MSDENKDAETATPNFKGKDPLDQVANSLLEAKKKAKTEEYKKSVVEVEKAEEVFSNAVSKSADIARELAALEKTDMRALFQAVGV